MFSKQQGLQLELPPKYELRIGRGGCLILLLSSLALGICAFGILKVGGPSGKILRKKSQPTVSTQRGEVEGSQKTQRILKALGDEVAGVCEAGRSKHSCCPWESES